MERTEGTHQGIRPVPDGMAQDDRSKLYDLAKEMKIAMLTTIELDGSLHARPMFNKEIDENGDFWFFIERGESTEKNIGGNPQVSLGFADLRGNDYVAISGTGTVIYDRATIESKWNEAMTAWFPEGKTDPKIALLRVHPERGEFWDAKSSLVSTVVGFIKAKLGGGPANDLMDQGKVSLG